MKYLKTLEKNPDHKTFYCPACDADHEFRSQGEGAWEVSGDKKKPSVHPSIRVRGFLSTRTEENVEVHCHLLIRDGKIHYCSDSQHDMAGEVVPMVPYED